MALVGDLDFYRNKEPEMANKMVNITNSINKY